MELPVSAEVFGRLPASVRDGGLIRVKPVLFTQGINEQQSIANQARPGRAGPGRSEPSGGQRYSWGTDSRVCAVCSRVLAGFSLVYLAVRARVCARGKAGLRACVCTYINQVGNARKLQDVINRESLELLKM